MKHCSAKASQYEASPVFISLRRGKPFHSDMKHSAYAPYDEKMEKREFTARNTTLSALYYYRLHSISLWQAVSLRYTVAGR